MKTIFLSAAMAALTLLPGAALASDIRPPAATTTASGNGSVQLQAQIDALRHQVAALQKQVNTLQSTRTPSVCISVWCA